MSATWVMVIDSFSSVNVPAISAVKSMPTLAIEAPGQKRVPDVVPPALNVMVRLPPAASTSTSSMASPDRANVEAA